VEPFAKGGARVRTKRLWIFLVGLVLTVGGLTPAIYFALGALLGGFYAAVLGVALYFGAMFGSTHLWNTKWLERSGRLRADERGLWLDDAIVVPRSVLRHGSVIQRDGVAYVRLGRWLQPVEIVVEDELEGGALLAAMRLDAARSVGQFTMNHGSYASSWLKAIAGVVAFLVGTSLVILSTWNPVVLFGWLIAAMVASFVWAANQFVRVSVGADGVHLRRLLARPRFIAFGALESATIEGKNVTIRTRDGLTFVVHHLSSGKGWKPLLYRDRADEGQLLVDRINAQAEMHRRGGPDVRVLARGARSTSEWLQAVARASDEHASFREPAVPIDELWRIVEDPVASTTARAGAALALRTKLDEPGRARLRVVADACAAPKLRVALQTAASDAKPETLEEAFEPLEDEGARRAGA
jgi:hypothetical protein